MRYLMIALQVEVKKTFRSYMLKIMFVIFTLAALLAAFFIYILMDPDMARNTGMLGTYIDLYGGANWEIYVTFFKEIISIGGIIAFGFVLSWLFGREYSDGTMTDLLALPFARVYIVLAKYLMSVIVSILLTIYMLLLGVLLGSILHIPDFSLPLLMNGIFDVIFISIMTLIISTPVAFFAMLGRGYLLPLGYVIVTVILSQIISVVGLGAYFPWSIPAIYSGVVGEEQILTSGSLLILLGTGMAGIIVSFLYIEYAEQP